ncbi:glycosyltransferase [Marinobacter metalliresistant]|uniref:Glycosyltransferase n=1 Tax=Marinobacter metalliresistant TaxID=2961995 RepID=A0ABZ2W3W4_9GAMM
MQNENDRAVTYSVVIGRVSTEDDERILETLESLDNQDEDPSREVLLADRISDHVSQRIRSEYPDVKIIECPPTTDLPTMRTLATKQAAGDFVLVTEDHCVPPRDWLKQFARAFAEHPEASAIGGSVVNGVTDTALDWATFLCEYAPMSPPIESGPTPNLAGMNVAYRREIFEEVDEQILTSGFWETTLHPLLHRQGHVLVADDNVRIFHCKKFSLGLFLRQRFVYSRYYAGIRFATGQKAKRLIYAMASVALPPLLTLRFFQNARHKVSVRSHLAEAAPYLMLFYLVWGAGEAWGYLFGPRDALQEIE